MIKANELTIRAIELLEEKEKNKTKKEVNTMNLNFLDGLKAHIQSRLRALRDELNRDRKEELSFVIVASPFGF